MSKETFYFSHDYNTRTDEKIKLLIMNHGMVGYGVFWAIIEDLYNNANALRTHYERIAYDLRVDEKVVKSIINDFDLFVFDGDFFGSLSIQSRLNQRIEKSASARKSALCRWSKDANALNTNANAMRKDEKEQNRNAIKERKGKESILNNNTNAANAASSVQSLETLKKPKPEVAGYAECIAVYDNWLKGRTGVGVKMDGMQGKAMKEIIKYLDSQKLNKEQPVEEVWEFILNSWDKLTDYHKNKLKLSEINSDLINIINQIKNGKQKHTNQDAVAFAISLLRDI